MVKYSVPFFQQPMAFLTWETKAYIEKQETPIVVKTDGSSGAKLMIVLETVEQAVGPLTMLLDNKFGDSVRVVIEEFLARSSPLCLCQWRGFTLCRQHKTDRPTMGTKGPNTAWEHAPITLPQSVVETVGLGRLSPFSRHDSWGPTLSGLCWTDSDRWPKVVSSTRAGIEDRLSCVWHRLCASDILDKKGLLSLAGWGDPWRSCRRGYRWTMKRQTLPERQLATSSPAGVNLRKIAEHLSNGVSAMLVTTADTVSAGKKIYDQLEKTRHNRPRVIGMTLVKWALQINNFCMRLKYRIQVFEKWKNEHYFRG